MSELKARTARSIADEEEMLELGADCPIEQTQVYLKSEADKVIANRDYEIENLKESISNLLKMKTEQVMDEVMEKALIYGEGFVSVEQAMKLVAELRHQKYKRCAAMARWCCDACDKWMMRKAKAIVLGKDGVKEYYQAKRKLFLFMRWQTRWLKIAEKIKEGV